MSDRIEVSGQDLENVVGGALVWEKGIVYPKDNPDAVYHYSSFNDCIAYITKYWKGGAQTEETLKMLQDAKLVWQ